MWRLGEGSELVSTEMERKPWGIINNSEEWERLLGLGCAERGGGVSRGGGAQPQDCLVPKPAPEPTQGQSLRGVRVKVG